MPATNSNLVATPKSSGTSTAGESKGDDGSMQQDGIAERNKEFFRTKRDETEHADAEVVQEKHAARSQLSPKARQEAEDA